MVTQALASTTENDLLKMMITVRDELSLIILKHEISNDFPDNVPVLELGNHKIEAVTFID